MRIALVLLAGEEAISEINGPYAKSWTFIGRYVLKHTFFASPISFWG